jgi:hypothetical protein
MRGPSERDERSERESIGSEQREILTFSRSFIQNATRAVSSIESIVYSPQMLIDPNADIYTMMIGLIPLTFVSAIACSLP